MSGSNSNQKQDLLYSVTHIYINIYGYIKGIMVVRESFLVENN